VNKPSSREYKITDYVKRQLTAQRLQIQNSTRSLLANIPELTNCEHRVCGGDQPTMKAIEYHSFTTPAPSSVRRKAEIESQLTKGDKYVIKLSHMEHIELIPCEEFQLTLNGGVMFDCYNQNHV
jgi:hypothetical protein